MGKKYNLVFEDNAARLFNAGYFVDNAARLFNAGYFVDLKDRADAEWFYYIITTDFETAGGTNAAGSSLALVGLGTLATGVVFNGTSTGSF